MVWIAFILGFLLYALQAVVFELCSVFRARSQDRFSHLQKFLDNSFTAGVRRVAATGISGGGVTVLLGWLSYLPILSAAGALVLGAGIGAGIYWCYRRLRY